MTPERFLNIPEVLSVQEIPSEEVRMVPFQPTVTKSPFPEVTPIRYKDVTEDLLVHAIQSEEESIFPDLPTVTKALLA